MPTPIKIVSTIIATIIVALIILVLVSAFQDDIQDEEILGEESNRENLDEKTEDFDELIIETITKGEGGEAKDGDTLTLHYTGKLINGEVFDSSHNRNQPFSFTLGTGQVIQGWEKGVQGMKIGETRKLQIPSSMGYGTTGTGNIPPNAGLEFEVELLEISN